MLQLTSSSFQWWLLLNHVPVCTRLQLDNACFTTAAPSCLCIADTCCNQRLRPGAEERHAHSWKPSLAAMLVHRKWKVNKPSDNCSKKCCKRMLHYEHLLQFSYFNYEMPLFRHPLWLITLWQIKHTEHKYAYVHLQMCMHVSLQPLLATL